MSKKLLMLIAVLSCGLLTQAYGYEMYDGGQDQAYDKLGGELGTPHIKWAKPYAGGKIKALVICGTWGHWETLEIAQRLDLDYTPIMAASSASLEKSRGSNQVSGDVVLKLARARLAGSYDLIIIGKMKWSAFPEDIQAAITKKVRSGTGLVYVSGSAAEAMPGVVYRSNAADLFRGVPWQRLPAKKTFIRLGQAGKGRVALVNCKDWNIPPVQYRGSTGPFSPFLTRNDPLLYECYFSAFLRTVLWAVDKEPGAKVTRVTISRAAIDREALPAAAVEVSLAGERPASVECIISDESSLELLRFVPDNVSLEKLRVTIPKLKTGKYLLSVIARDADGRSIGWASAPFEVTSAVTVGEVKIDREDKVFANGETVSGSFALAGRLAPGQEIVVELVDNYGRLLARETPARGKTGFALRLNHTLSSVNDVRVQCRDRDGIIDEKTVMVTCPEFNSKWDDFTFIIWVTGRDARNSRLVRDSVKRHGFDVLYGPSAVWDPGGAAGAAATAAREHFEVALYATRMASGQYAGVHHAVKGPDGPMVNECFWTNEEAFSRQILGNLRRNIVPYLPYGVAVYSLGDENMLSIKEDYCFCPSCQADFRKFIKGWYGDLAKVNREWGSNYKSWQAVKPISLVDARKQNRYPQWIDHRYHMEDVFYQAHKKCVDLIRGYDADARIGNSDFCYVDALSGPDIPRLMRLYGAGSMGTYDTPLIAEQIRSFAHKDNRLLMWWGVYNGQKRPEYKTYELWHHILLGMKGNQWYRWTGGGLGGEAATTINPTVPLPYVAAASERIHEVKGGIGKLFFTAQKLEDPIAIHYSSASKFASVIRPDESTWQLSNEDFIRLVRDSGFGFNYVDTEDIEQGRLVTDGYRVLILPYSQAVSALEVENIKAFVRNGGLLLADYSPAIMDEHGKTLERSALSGLFGPFEKVRSAQHGQGHAVYLGDFYAGYSALHKAGKGVGKRDSFRMMLKELAGLNPKMVLSGSDLPPLETGVFRNGATTLYGVLATPTSGEAETLEVRVWLPNPNYIYDIRKKAFLGMRETVTISVSAGEAVVLATVPKEIRSLELATDKAVYRPGQTVRLNAAIDVETGTVIRIEVAGADGRLIRHYCANVQAPSGKIAYEIPLALNEAPGRYTITATDIISGLSYQKEISVEE